MGRESVASSDASGDLFAFTAMAYGSPYQILVSLSGGHHLPKMQLEVRAGDAKRIRIKDIRVPCELFPSLDTTDLHTLFTRVPAYRYPY